MNIHLVVIDPQKDFCDPKGALYVGGADADMERLAEMVLRVKDKLDDIHVTLDSHHVIDIAHPIFWQDSNGKHPAPFTIISEEDVKNGKWSTTNPKFLPRASEYVQKLAANKRYPLCIWPPHCLIGSDGHKVQPVLYKALLQWENEYFAMVDYVTKGSNYFTEHYSAVVADVPDPTDPGTMLNTGFIETLKKADIIALAGEAKSHCLANTVTDIANNFGEENISKFVLLDDCSSNVTGFDKMGDDFVKEMVKRGMKISNSKDFLK
jgi:nicotinamidase-related amidase